MGHPLDSFDWRVFAPVEAAAEDSFDDEVVGCGGWADADADVDLPLGRDIEVSDGEDLLLLIVQGIKGAEAAVVRIVLEAAADDGREVVANFGARSETEALFDVRAVE